MSDDASATATLDNGVEPASTPPTPEQQATKLAHELTDMGALRALDTLHRRGGTMTGLELYALMGVLSNAAMVIRWMGAISLMARMVPEHDCPQRLVYSMASWLMKSFDDSEGEDDNFFPTANTSTFEDLKASVNQPPCLLMELALEKAVVSAKAVPGWLVEYLLELKQKRRLLEI